MDPSPAAEIYILKTHSAKTFSAARELEGNQLTLSLAYVTDRTGLILDNMTAIFNPYVKEGLYVITCTAHLKGTKKRIDVDQPIYIARKYTCRLNTGDFF